VDDSTSVEVANAHQKLLHYYHHVVLTNRIVLKVVENFTAMNLLHHNEHPPLGLVNFPNFHNVRRTQKANDLYFVP
jgi:hypothetical protein